MTLEFFKLRHLKVWIIPVLMTFGVVAMSLFRALASGALSNPETLWKLLLASMSFAIALVYPLLIAVLSSRVVDAEHKATGWLLFASSGTLPGTLLRRKLLTTGTLLFIATLTTSFFLAIFGFSTGAGSSFPTSIWLGFTAAALVVSFVVLATQLFLSALIDNQLVCLAIGVGGLFLAIFGQAFPTWLNHLTPWGYFSLIRPADYQGLELVYFDFPLISMLILTASAGILIPAVCTYFDRKEL